MGLVQRLKRLWELSGTPGPQTITFEAPPEEPIDQEKLHEELLKVLQPEGKPKGMATIVPDEPEEIFPVKDDYDTNDEQPKDN